MPGVFRYDLTNVCALLPLPPIAHAAAGASGAWHSLRPLTEAGGTFGQNSRETRGEIVKLCLNKNPNTNARHLQPSSRRGGRDDIAYGATLRAYPSNTASAPFTASALSITVRSSEGACTEMFSAKNRASVT
jgi:hypothetical protein